MSAEPARALWCELAWLGGERAEAEVLVELDGERIASVAAGVSSPPAEAISLRGLTIPGLANAHSHAFQRALRGRTQAERGDFWAWRRRMYEIAEQIDPDRYLALARATFGEMALAGITAVGEFHYLHHGPGGARYDDPNALGKAVIAAARRGRDPHHAARHLLPARRDRPAGRGSPASVLRRQRRGLGGAGGSAASRVRGRESVPRSTASAPSTRRPRPGPRRSPPRGPGLSTPTSPNRSQRTRTAPRAYGRSPTALLAEAGALSERFTAVHATHLDAADIDLLGGGGCGVCLCPTTERDLADGVGPARRLAEAGARLSLGTDSHALIDVFEEARAVELDERLESGVRGGHSAAELLRAATAGGLRGASAGPRPARSRRRGSRTS